MPHDREGNLLSEGDIVMVPAVVKSVSTGTDYCNVSLETVESMYPGEHKSAMSLNAKQVVKAAGFGITR